jgi:flagellar biosynthesis GTPase FlhF
MTTDADAAAKQQTEAQKKHAEETKKKLAEERTAREKSHKESAETQAKVKPTPTQEENDLAASGVHVEEHEPDGSPEEAVHAQTLKQSETSKHPIPPKGSYPNRAMGSPSSTDK